jgi:hypothetical protein
VAGDPIDDLASALFAAARRERATDDVRERILASMTSAPEVDAADEPIPESSSAIAPAPVATIVRRRRYAVGFAVAAAVAALAGTVVLMRGRSEPVFSIGPERSARLDDMSPAPSLPKVVDEPAPEPVSPVPTVEKPARARAVPRAAARDGATAQKVEVAPPPSLPDEIATLDRARTALSSGDVQGALRILDDYDRVLRGTRLTAEATMLRIDALARSGRNAEASALAARFVEANPSSALADRARAFIKTSNSSRVDAGGLK